MDLKHFNKKNIVLKVILFVIAIIYFLFSLYFLYREGFGYDFFYNLILSLSFLCILIVRYVVKTKKFTLITRLFSILLIGSCIAFLKSTNYLLFGITSVVLIIIIMMISIVCYKKTLEK